MVSCDTANKKRRQKVAHYKVKVKNKEMKLAPKVKLNNGLEMPILGLGTYKSKHTECEEAVKYAIDNGYRHIDTAYGYQNEIDVGRAINAKISDGTVKREDLFITTKLSSIFHDPERVEYACKKSLENLDLDYIDLYLMHEPYGITYVNDELLFPCDRNGKLQMSDVDYLDTWKAMEKLVQLGLVKSIGVSNFNSQQIKRILDNCTVKPVTNQVECHPGFNQKKLIEFCRKYDIVITAYSPLGRPIPDLKFPNFIFNEEMITLANKYNKITTQVVLRYLIQCGTCPIPKSVTKERIKQNFDVFDFELQPEDIQLIDNYHTGKRFIPFSAIKELKHKYYPFDIEF